MRGGRVRSAAVAVDPCAPTPGDIEPAAARRPVANLPEVVLPTGRLIDDRHVPVTAAGRPGCSRDAHLHPLHLAGPPALGAVHLVQGIRRRRVVGRMLPVRRAVGDAGAQLGRLPPARHPLDDRRRGGAARARRKPLVERRVVGVWTPALSRPGARSKSPETGPVRGGAARGRRGGPWRRHRRRPLAHDDNEPRAPMQPYTRPAATVAGHLPAPAARHRDAQGSPARTLGEPAGPKPPVGAAVLREVPERTRSGATPRMSNPSTPRLTETGASTCFGAACARAAEAHIIAVAAARIEARVRGRKSERAMGSLRKGCSGLGSEASAPPLALSGAHPPPL